MARHHPARRGIVPAGQGDTGDPQRNRGHKDEGGAKTYAGFYAVIAQIAVIDMVFSVDSIITAIGMTEYIGVMIIAVTIAIAVMFIASEPATAFIKRHPTTKMLALAFLILIGALLVADGLGFHVPRGYVYFAMGFAAWWRCSTCWPGGRGAAVRPERREMLRQPARWRSASAISSMIASAAKRGSSAA